MPSFFEKLFKGKATVDPAPSQPPARQGADGASAQSQPALSPAATCATAQTPSTLGGFDALYAKALSAAAAQDFARAIPLYDQAIAANPASAEPYYKRANALKDVGRLEEAVASYNEAIARKPDYAYAFCNRGTVQQRLGLLAAAVSSLDQAIALDPADTVAHYNRALVLQDCSRWEEAVASYDRALALNPVFSEARYNRALTLMFLGDFERGWPAFECRWDNAERLAIGEVKRLQEPLWLGDASIAGKRLLIHNEAGLGDTLQFCRYARLAAARSATVLLQVQPSLVGLLSNLEGVSQVIPAGGALPPFDYHCPTMSLPLAFNTTLDTVPASRSYLRNDPGKVARWRQRLGERTRPRIGLTWSGNANQPIEPRRRIPLADWLPHLPPEFEYFCLQKDLRAPDRAARDASQLIVSFDDELPDFAATAALCECMDLVVTVDTSVAHLSGALGQRTWVLLSFIPDWRWLLDRDDSPWYPGMKLYRQKTAGDWSAVFARVAADLRREFPAD
jgi:tetratricopeptide (TPR) repeat protein